MTLRKQTLVVIAVTTAALIAVLYVASRTIVMKGFSELEKRLVRQNVERTLEAVSYELKILNNHAADWAEWDDTYNFVAHPNEYYVKANQTNRTYGIIRANIMLFFSSAGQFVFGKGFDLESRATEPYPEELKRLVLTTPRLLRHADEKTSVTGIILLPKGPLLFASRPVLNSQHTGPMRGTLLVGRYLNDAEIRRLGKRLHVNLKIQRFDDPQIPIDFKESGEALGSNGKIPVIPLTNHAVAGFALLKDIFGKPALVLQVQMDRQVYKEGESTLVYLILSICVASLVFGAVILQLVESRILSRLIGLGRNLAKIASTGKPSERVQTTGNDELTALADGINATLGSVERSERALRESEERLKLALEGSKNGFWDWDLVTGAIARSGQWEERLGYERNEIQPSVSWWIGLIHPDDRPVMIKARNDHLKGLAKHYETEFRLRSKAGEWRWILDRGKVVTRDGRGKPLRMAGTHTDITERKRAEEALKISEEKYRLVVENANEAIVVVQHGKLKFVNRKAIEISGYGEDELISRPFLDFVHPEDRDATAQRYQKRLKDEPTSGVHDFRLQDKNWDTKWMEVTSLKINWQGEVATLNFLSDITAKRKMEEQFLRLEKIQSLGVFAGGIAHDFNNILTAILGNISLAKAFTSGSDKVFERLSEAEKACLQAQGLTQQLLTFSKGGEPVKKVADIARLVRDSCLFALRGSRVRLNVSVPDDLWQAEVDEGQISQVIGNLVLNGDQAMPQGGIMTVQAENVIEKADNGLLTRGSRYVKISVKDQGIGIPEEHISKIFDPYFTTKHKGSGLGLATAYSIIKNHDGLITVDSKLGVGTTLHVYLPAISKEIAVREESERELVKGKGRILLMDDEESIRVVGEEILSLLGYEVATANDGAEALALYGKAADSSKPFDAIIMDLTVPGGMGGAEAIQVLLEIDPAVKAIVSSGYSNDPVMADPGKYGFKGVVAKPYSVQELSEVLGQVIAGPSRDRATGGNRL